MPNIVLAVLLVGLWTQAPPPIRIGPTSDQLAGEDLGQIAAIARQEGGLVWLILGRSLSGPGGSSIPWESWTFLEPAAHAGPVRRGVLLRLVAQLPAVGAFASPKSWTIRAKGHWAQIVPPETTAATTENSHDVHRPFAVDEGLSDTILQEVVEVIRRSPALGRPVPTSGSQTPSPLLTQVQGSWAILAVRLQPDASVEVTLVRGADELSGQSVVLRRVANHWVVSSVNFWIA
jgi:hypothetical protein